MRTLFVMTLNLWTGCCAVALSEATRLLSGLPLAFGALEAFVFGGALFAYNIVRRGAVPREFAWGFGAAALLCLLQLQQSTQWAAVVPFVIWALYYGARGLVHAPLRRVPLLKPLAVAVVWSWVSVLLPLPPERWATVPMLLLGRTAFLFGLALGCDLCDADVDRAHGLDTLALRLGSTRSFRVIDGALAAAAVCVLANLGLGYYRIGVSATLLVFFAGSAWAVRAIVRVPIGCQLQKATIDALMFAQFAAILLHFVLAGGVS